MFGTIICSKNELSQEEQKRYRSVYCGLCRSLKKRFGQWERLTLNYDMTFLAMFLNSLYDEEAKSEKAWCGVHPFTMQEVLKNKYIDYAADMTILLSYYKCKDDWEDEQKRTSRRYMEFLEPHYEKITQIYPRQASCVKNSLERATILEKSGNALPDEVANCSGRMLSEIFVMKEDFWSDSLRTIGYELGRFTYLMDACLDYEQDKRKKNYNPLCDMNKKPEEMELYLMQAIGNATCEFEKLPIIQDINILRNILYGGVWQKYYAKINRKEEKNGNRSV